MPLRSIVPSRPSTGISARGLIDRFEGLLLFGSIAPDLYCPNYERTIYCLSRYIWKLRGDVSHGDPSTCFQPRLVCVIAAPRTTPWGSKNPNFNKSSVLDHSQCSEAVGLHTFTGGILVSEMCYLDQDGTYAIKSRALRLMKDTQLHINEMGSQNIMSFLMALQHCLRVDLRNCHPCPCSQSKARRISGSLTYDTFEALGPVQYAWPVAG
jgi:hypothetical protein